jgi:hypothetical protein
MWKHMMQAGEEYIKQTLKRDFPATPRVQASENPRRYMVV